MPTIIDQDGCRVMIYTDEHPPAHVYVKVRSSVVAFYLDERITLKSNFGVKANDLRKAREIIKANRELLLQKWFDLHQ